MSIQNVLKWSKLIRWPFHIIRETINTYLIGQILTNIYLCGTDQQIKWKNQISFYTMDLKSPIIFLKHIFEQLFKKSLIKV